MWTGWLELSMRLGDTYSAKARTALLDTVGEELRSRFAVSAAEVQTPADHRDAVLGISLVASERRHVSTVLDRAEMLVASRPDIEVVDVRSRVWNTESDPVKGL